MKTAYSNFGKQVLHVEGDTQTHIAEASDGEKAHFLATAANAYSDFDYMAEADKTCSIVFNPQNVEQASFVRTLALISELCDQLNVAKKLLFRGKSCEEVGRAQPALADSLAVEFDRANPFPGEIDILHGIVGVITEAGEMADLLLNRLKTGEFDRVNALEECGDVQWYIVRQLRGMGATLELMQRSNIDKLHGRHGEAFDVFRDANRDLSAERKRLEADAAPLLESITSPTPLDAVPPRQRNNPPLPVGSFEQHKRNAGDVEGMDC